MRFPEVECGHEWSPEVSAGSEEPVCKGANGIVFQDRDTVTVIKALKVYGSSLVVKVETRVKYIRFVEGEHDIDCKIDGIGPMQLKTELVKTT